MEPLDDQSMNDNSQLSPKILDDLKATAPWLKFVGTTGIVIAILYFIIVMVLQSELQANGNGGLVGVLVAAIIMFFLYLMLLQYGQNLGKFISTRDTKELEQAFAKQRTFWMVAGIMMILALVFVVIAVIAILAMGEDLFDMR